MGSFGIDGLGLGEGIDVQRTVAQLLELEAAPIRLLQQQQSRLDAQSAAFAVINTKLNTLSSRVDSLADISGTFNSKSVTSSNSDLLTASATSLALEASHIIQITTLATTSVAVINETFADGETDIGATGKFTIQVGSGTAFEVVVDSTNSTLDGIAETINNLEEDVSASVIIDANGARLSLTSKPTGLDGDLTITQDGTDPVETISFNVTTATNATFTVNSISIESSSNTVNDVIPGVTINLIGASPGTDIALNIRQDTAKAKAAIQSFVTAFNALSSDINSQSSVNETGSMPGVVLAGDSSLRLIQGSIFRDLNFRLTDNNGIESIAAVGITMGDDGTLTVDSAELDTALASNFEDVQAFVQAFGDNFKTDLDNLTHTTDGVVNLALKNLTTSRDSLQLSIENFESRLLIRQDALIREFSLIDTILRQLPLIRAQIEAQLSTLASNSLT